MLTARVVVLALLLASCGIPRDPEGTLDRVEGGVMRVGITENEPWTVLEDSEPQGVEVDLIEAFARQLDAEIDWTVGAAEEVLEATEEGDLDLAIGGFLADDPWATRVSFIQPYATVGEDQHVMATPHGENAWIVRLERFLRSNRDRVTDLLREDAS